MPEYDILCKGNLWDTDGAACRLLLAKQCHNVAVLLFEYKLLVRVTRDLIHPRLLNLDARLIRLGYSDMKAVALQLEVFSNVVDSGMKKGGVLWVYRRSPNVPTRHRSTPPWMILATRFASCH